MRDAAIVSTTAILVSLSIVFAYVIGIHQGQKATGFHDVVPTRDFHQAVHYDLGYEPPPVTDVVVPHPHVFPGAEVVTETSVCTVGAVVDNSIIIAGHCTEIGDVVSVGSNTFTVVSIYFENLFGPDWAIATSTGDVNMANAMPADDVFMKIQGVTSPEEGMKVCALGSTTGWVCGKISTVDKDIFHMTMCVRHGDSGSLVITPDGKMVGIVNGAYLSNGHHTCVDGYNNHNGNNGSYATSLDYIGIV